MRLLKRVWDWLTSSSRALTKKGHPDLYPLDVAKLADELDLVGEAKRLGEAGHPPSDAIELCGPEATIVQRVEKARQDYVDWAVLRLNFLKREILRKNVTHKINRASQADEEFNRKASSLLSEKVSLLSNLREIATRRRAELETFQAKNRLERDAHYPHGASLYLRYSLLLALVVVEAFLNAGFFAEGVSTGLIGGFIYAGTLATVNVIVAFIFGKLLIRNIHHVNTVRKALGGIFLTCALLTMVTIGLGIAHVRDSLNSGIDEPARVALKTLIDSPLLLGDIFSWLLFIISIFFAVIALFDGYYSDDKYPGYGSITRRTREAIDDYEEELCALRAELEELKEDQLKLIDDTVRESQLALSMMQTFITDKNGVKSRLSNALRDVDNSLAALLRKFRTENEIVRGSMPPPAYFNRPIQLRQLRMPDYVTANDEAMLAEQKMMVNALVSDVQNLRSAIQAAYNQQYDRLKPLDNHFFQQEPS